MRAGMDRQLEVMRHVATSQTSLDGGGGPPHSPGMEARLAKLEGVVDGFRTVPAIALTALSIVMAAVAIILTIGVFQFNGMNSRIDGLSRQVTDEFKALRSDMAALRSDMTTEARASRADMSAQTAAIAGSITAARQVQPQIMVVPGWEPRPTLLPVPPAPKSSSD